MVAVVSPHRTHESLVRYVAHLVLWWLASALSSYGLSSVGVPYRVDWSERMPRHWRAEARRGIRDCECLLAARGRPPTHDRVDGPIGSDGGCG